MKSQIKTFFVATFFATISVSAATERVAHLLAVGQGTAFPSVTSTINFSHGTTAENPVGIVYQDGGRISAELIPGESGGDDTFGVEAGYSGQGWGLAAGHIATDCDGCEGRTTGAVALEVGNWFALGLRFEEELYSVGTVFNSSGRFRFGVTAELNDPEGEDNNINNLEAGFAFVSSDFVFAVDAGTRSFENDAITDDRIYITPGVAIHAGMLQVSLNYTLVTNEEDDAAEEDNNFWLGIGLGDQDWHVAFYSDYVADSSFVASFFF